MLDINSAFMAYLHGDLDGWDLLEVIEDHGFNGYTINEDGILIIS